MSNNGRYTLCPFYRDEKNKSISCEDVVRTFRYTKEKHDWMDTFCDKDWKNCVYARTLLDMYEQIEKGDAMAEEKHTIDALRTELKKVKSMLGRAEKRLEPKEEEIRKLRKKNQKLEAVYFEEHKKRLQAEKDYKALETKGFAEINKLTQIYEDRMCYMIDMFVPLQKISEKEMEKWAKDKEFALTFEREGEDLFWKVVQRDAKK